MEETKERVITAFDLDSKTPVQIRVLLDEKKIIDVGGKKISVNKIGGVETRGFIVRVMNEKIKAAEQAQMKKDYNQSHTEYVNAGSLDTWLIKEGDNVIIKNPAELGGG